MDLTKVKRDDWILGGVALLLAIDLLFFPWFDISFSFGGSTASATSTATGSPDGWAGFLAMLCLIALIADLAIERLSPQTRLPSLGGGRAATRLALAGAAAAFVALKFILHIHFSLFGWGFYLGVLLTVLLVVLAAQARQGRAFAMPSRRVGGGAARRDTPPGPEAPPVAMAGTSRPRSGPAEPGAGPPEPPVA